PPAGVVFRLPVEIPLLVLAGRRRGIRHRERLVFRLPRLRAGPGRNLDALRLVAGPRAALPRSAAAHTRGNRDVTAAADGIPAASRRLLHLDRPVVCDDAHLAPGHRLRHDRPAGRAQRLVARPAGAGPAGPRPVGMILCFRASVLQTPSLVDGRSGVCKTDALHRTRPFGTRPHFTGTGERLQISAAYSRIVRSLENFPERAVLRIA